jgi:hypothetical protein
MCGLSMATMKPNEAAAPQPISFATPWVGTTLTALSGLVFAFLCMILPLVGKAARSVPHYAQNRSAFLVILLASLVLAALATISKLARRSVDGSPRPLASGLLIVIDLLLLVAFATGGLAI